MSFGNFLDSAETKSNEQKELEKALNRKQEVIQKQSQQYLNDLFKENITKPINVSSIQVNNSDEFRISFLNRQFAPLNKDSSTLGEFFHGIEEVSKNLSRVNVLQNLVIGLDSIPSKTSLFSRTNPDLINLVPQFNLFPVKKFFAKTGSNIGNGEGDGYIQFQFRNLFGGGENMSFDATTGTRTSSSYLVNYNMPVNNNTRLIWDNSGYINTRALEWIGCETKNLGFTTKLTHKWTDKITHEASIDTIWRILSNKTSKSTLVFNQCGHNIKNALNYGVHYDSRDSVHLPTNGYFGRIGLEFNGLSSFSSNKHVKAVIEGQAAVPLTSKHNLIFTNKFGAIKTEKDTSSFILDRFFIGGPNDVRSFTLNGLGPKSYGNSIGGDLFVNGGVSLISKVPYTAQDSNFKIHNFFNYGSVQLHDKSLGFKGNGQRLFNSFSSSFGVGILYNHPMARFELNFVLPLTAHQKDSTRKGLQYGIGVSFL